ncbi:MAG: hypothetical protein JWO38_251 [Gemmataceae bacterium]|nr:hypothetical protein [Gemmataceae bacterium]
MEYDLIRLFDEHACCLFEYIPATIVTFEQDGSNQREIGVAWRTSATESTIESTLAMKWDLDAIRAKLPMIDRQLQSRRERDDDRATRTEEAAIVVAAAVMAHVEPGSRFTWRSDTGTRHDYYLNDTDDEMIEIAGRWEDGLSGLFDQKRAQSDRNPTLRKRWVSVTIVRRDPPRNRTEGLHS